MCCYRRQRRSHAHLQQAGLEVVVPQRVLFSHLVAQRPGGRRPAAGRAGAAAAAAAAADVFEGLFKRGFHAAVAAMVGELVSVGGGGGGGAHLRLRLLLRRRHRRRLRALLRLRAAGSGGQQPGSLPARTLRRYVVGLLLHSPCTAHGETEAERRELLPAM